MKIIKLILLLCLIYTVITFERRSHLKNKNHHRRNHQIKPTTNPHSGKIFKDKTLDSNPTKDDLLSNEAITKIISSMGVSQVDSSNCVKNLDVNTKKQILGSLITIGKSGSLDVVSKQKLNVIFKCKNLESLATKFADKASLVQMSTIVQEFTRRFFRRIR